MDPRVKEQLNTLNYIIKRMDLKTIEFPHNRSEYERIKMLEVEQFRRGLNDIKYNRI